MTAPSPQLQALLAELGDSALTGAIDQLVALEDLVAARAVTIPEINIASVAVHRWKPPAPPQFPAIYNVLPDAPHGVLDTMTEIDTLQLRARVAVRHTKLDAELRQWELLADVFRAVVDPALRKREALTVSRDPRRTGMRWATDVWEPMQQNGTRVLALCMEFSLDVPLRRTVPRR